MKTDKQFVNILEDSIQKHSDMGKISRDSAHVEITDSVKYILRACVIDNWSSEPHQQQQNPIEQKYQHVKRTTNHMMERTGLLANTMSLAVSYCLFPSQSIPHSFTGVYILIVSLVSHQTLAPSHGSTSMIII